MLDEGKVISVSEWKSRLVDAPVVNNKPIVTSSSKLSEGTSKETYYGVRPYLFMSASSSHKLAFQNPANSNSQLKTHRIDGTQLPSLYGSPVIFMSIITDETLKASVKEETMTDIWANASLAGASAPAFGKTDGSTWIKGSVICVEYLTYTQALAGGKPTDATQVHKIGYMHIKDVTCGDASTGLATTDREGYVLIDLYWSNIINE